MKAAENETMGTEQDTASEMDQGESFGSDYKQRLMETGRNIREDTSALAGTVSNAAQELSAFVEAQLQERPYATLGIAAGVGYVLGGGLSLGFGRMLFGTGGRVLATLLVQQLAKAATGQHQEV